MSSKRVEQRGRREDLGNGRDKSKSEGRDLMRMVEASPPAAGWGLVINGDRIVVVQRNHPTQGAIRAKGIGTLGLKRQEDNDIKGDSGIDAGEAFKRSCGLG